MLSEQVARGGEIRTHEVSIQSGRDGALQLTVDGDKLALEGLRVVACSTAVATCSAEALRFEHIAMAKPATSSLEVGLGSTNIVRKRVVHWKQHRGNNHSVISSELKQLVGESVSLRFVLPHGGVLSSFGFESLQ